MAPLRMRLLGQPELRHGEQLLALPTRKSLGLLVYLAVESGLHAREKLAALFWPDSDHPHSRGMLRYTVSSLRRVLEHPGGEEHVIVKHDALGFDPAADLDIDLRAVAVAHTLACTSGMEPIAELRQATHLYRGEFLEGFSLPDGPDFDDWISRQREFWHQRIELVFDRLSQLEFDRGERVAALETVNRWLEISPLNEEAHRRLMRIHLAAADRSAALHAFEMCRSLLQRELQVAPSPETEALAERIRSEVGAPEQRSWQQGAASPKPTDLLKGPLVGRLDEFSQLVELFQASRQRNTEVVVLHGEPGIGKTRLAQEFIGWSEGNGADILKGAAFETGGGLPYQAVVDALRPRLERENAPEDLLSDVWLVELSRILPELRDRYPDLPVPAGDETAARTRMFEAIVRLGQALASRVPVVLFIDDLQWSDAGSLDVLSYAARRWAEEQTPMLMLLNLRDEGLTSPPLRDWLASLRRNASLTQIELRPLTLEDTRRFVLAMAGSGEPTSPSGPETTQNDDFIQWLFNETDGQPFFVVESLRELLERGVITLRMHSSRSWGIGLPVAGAGGLTGILPPGVRAVIDARLARLVPSARRTLDAGAVLGQGFTFKQLCWVAGLTELVSGLVEIDAPWPRGKAYPSRVKTDARERAH